MASQTIVHFRKQLYDLTEWPVYLVLADGSYKKCFCYSGLRCEFGFVGEPSAYVYTVASPPASPLPHNLSCLIIYADIHIVLYECKSSLNTLID